MQACIHQSNHIPGTWFRAQMAEQNMRNCVQKVKGNREKNKISLQHRFWYFMEMLLVKTGQILTGVRDVCVLKYNPASYDLGPTNRSYKSCMCLQLCFNGFSAGSKIANLFLPWHLTTWASCCICGSSPTEGIKKQKNMLSYILRWLWIFLAPKLIKEVIYISIYLFPWDWQ